ncbi:alcohol dehydrogenase catalytic domain-containing protein [Marinomonas ostreistagni]|uniref:Alcohol dehydrogenase catalytic domain-containing protein n=1 Tax=Marinomonas ostreistagni TaxID=359209 RepID=A0ABS0ZHM1_9GAMM|nr:alcohol dehydrogenase catalytic domain-containing protein [Marinomonas ostreistagni]MBJ7552666.1 alcohol dehydrogenase catalytic domain-containing protein [Marinomonas ostreistagni]
MKAIVFEAKNSSHLVNINQSVTLKEGEALVKTSACGLCHTDIEILKGNYGEDAYPVVPGHEYSGIVVEVNAKSDRVKVGNQVIVDPNIACGSCRSCEQGLTNLCENLEAYGVTQNGGFGEYSIVKVENLHPIENLDMRVAALAEPMACVLNALGIANLSKTQNALIYGAGPMGLMLGIALFARGITDVTVVDINQERASFASKLGFTAVCDSNELQTYDLTVDATGIPAVAESLISFTNSGGNIIFYGVCPKDAKISLSPFEVFRRQITIVGSHSLNKNIPESIEVLKHQETKLKQLITEVNSLSDVNDTITGTSKTGMKLQMVYI